MRVFPTKPVLGFAVFMAMALAVAACHPPPAGLVADYQFQGNRKSSVGSPPKLPALLDIIESPNGGNGFYPDTVAGSTRKVLVFPKGNGLRLNLPSDGRVVPSDSYTVVILFKFSDAPNDYDRILQVKSDNRETGLYRYCCTSPAGVLGFNGVARNQGNDPIPANTYVQVVLTRSSGGIVRGYLNGELEFDTTDNCAPTCAATIDGGRTLRFFHDNDLGLRTEEESAGAVARIRIWKRPLNPTEVKELHPLG